MVKTPQEPPSFFLSLHFSPRGEAKWVRGPSGLGASRAEEKGASRLARAGVLAKSPPSPFGLRNRHGFSGSLAVRHFFWSEPSPLTWFSRITRQETRITAFYRVLRPSGGEKCRLAARVKSPVEGAAGSCGRSRGVRRMAIRVISSDERQSRRPQMSVAQRVTRRIRSTAQSVQRRVPRMIKRYCIGLRRVTPPA